MARTAPLPPGDAAAVPVPAWVVRVRARDAVGREPLGDGEDPGPGEELGEDPLHDHCGRFVDREGAEALAVGGLGGIGVRADVNQLVAVGRSAAEVAALDMGLRCHGGADSDTDAVALAL